MVSELRGFWAEAGPIERVGYRIGVVLVASGVVHLGVFAADGGPWEGPVSWRKAVTFGLSFGVTLLTIVWIASFVPLRPRARRWLLGAFTAACVLETALVTMQVWREVPSHFDQQTTFDTIVSRVLAVGGGVLIVVVAVLTVASFRANPSVAPSLRLAVWAGFVALDVALLLGAVMIARGVSEVVAGHQQRAYVVGGFLKPGHAATMHGILILPALAWLASFAGWTERRRQQVVGLAAAGYGLFAAAVIAQSFIGWALVGLGLAGLGAVIVLACGVVTLAALRWRAPASTAAGVHTPGS